MTAVFITLIASITAMVITVIIDKGITDRERIRAMAGHDTPANKLIEGLFGKRGDDQDDE